MKKLVCIGFMFIALSSATPAFAEGGEEESTVNTSFLLILHAATSSVAMEEHGLGLAAALTAMHETKRLSLSMVVGVRFEFFPGLIGEGMMGAEKVVQVVEEEKITTLSLLIDTRLELHREFIADLPFEAFFLFQHAVSEETRLITEIDWLVHPYLSLGGGNAVIFSAEETVWEAGPRVTFIVGSNLLVTFGMFFGVDGNRNAQLRCIFTI